MYILAQILLFSCMIVLLQLALCGWGGRSIRIMVDGYKEFVGCSSVTAFLHVLTNVMHAHVDYG